MPSVYKYEIEALPLRVRKALKDSIKEPGNVAYADAPPVTKHLLKRAGWIAALLLLMVVALAADFGDPEKDPGWTGFAMLFWSGVFMAGVLYHGLHLWHAWRARKRLGFAPGRYVFSFALIDAGPEHITIYDLLQDCKISITEFQIGEVYQHTNLSFSFADCSTQTIIIADADEAHALPGQIDWLRDACRKAFDERDLKTLMRLDPLVELRKNKWQAIKTEAKRQHWLPASPLLGALMLSAVGAPLVWALRNSVNDVMMQREATRRHTEAAYQGYLQHGRFARTAMQADLARVALDEAKSKSSVSALRGFITRYRSDAALLAEAKASIHQLYQRSLAAFKAQAVTTDPALIASMEQLLTILETRGNPDLPLRFIRPSTATLSRLDARLRQAEQGFEIVPAASYFAANTAGVREARIVKELKTAFAVIFPNDVLNLTEAGSRTVKAPLLEIAYEIEPSGTIYSSDKSKRHFVGLTASFEGRLEVPEVETQWRFDLEVQPPNQFNVEYKGARSSTASGPADGQVYAVMAERAFDQLSEKIRSAFFRPGSTALLKQL